MIKAFISHSSAQKSFVHELVDFLGRNFCYVDCYDFQSAYKTIDEIYRKIEKSTVFVLLISRESLQSTWVSEEIRYAKNKLGVGELDRFWPFIIDESLSIQECPTWMKNDECFNLKKFKSPRMLAQDIEQKFRRIIWSEDKVRTQVETVMIGRNNDIDRFESIYQSHRGMKLKSLIISGRGGVGKDMFIAQCLDKIGCEQEAIPYQISLNSKEGIENFIIQLNLITRTYNKESLELILASDTSTKTQVAIKLFNEILNSGSMVSIDDDAACVHPNRMLADWIVEFVENPDLISKLGLFIKSRITPNAFVDTEHPLFGHLLLNPLDTKDRKKLFYKLIRLYNLDDISEDDVDFFVQRLLSSPSQIVRAVETLARMPIATVKRDINDLINWGDIQIKPLLQRFFFDETAKGLLVILSKLDFVSYEILERVYQEEVREIVVLLGNMMDYGIVTSFGPSEKYFRLDHYVCDYINRCHIKLPTDLEMLFNDVLEEKIQNSSDITEDVSVYLFEKKQLIISGKAHRKDFLIPSVVVTSVMEIYNDRKFDLVIKICDSVLNDVHNYYPDQERELRYWLCLALARTVNRRFFDEVKYIKDSDHYFLKGFYYRNAQEYNSSEKCLMKALEKSPNMQRAKRELVTALLAQEKYDAALKMARENYEMNPENSYQIQGYFRCLVRKEPLTTEDVDVLEELMKAMDENFSDKHEELYTAMNIEFQFYVNKTPSSKMLQLISEAERTFPNSNSVKRAIQSYNKRMQMPF